MAHCAEYGFILRYPVDKSEITGIGYEPWHYRYVGKRNAGNIMDSGLCLEEYLDLLEQNEKAPFGHFFDLGPDLVYLADWIFEISGSIIIE